MGNHPMSSCGKVITCDPEYEWDENETELLERSVNKLMADSTSRDDAQDDRPQLALRIAFSPIQDSLGARRSPFAQGDEVAVVKVQKVPGWEPMSWRQDRYAKQQAASNPASAIWPGPEESRFGRAQRFWAAKVQASDGKDGLEDYWCLLQVAMTKQDRSMEKVKDIVQDANDTASYAHRFNQHTARAVGEEPQNIPNLRVAAPVACFVIDSANPEVAGPGECVTLTFFPSNSVTKFVFEGGEDFLEMPQAFFHFVAWSSGGKELVADLQGVQDDQDTLLIDPCLIRNKEIGVNDLLSLVAGGAEQDGVSLTEKRFNLWHPRCAQLCRSFDPQRRSVNARRACGMALPTCGMGGA
eukprot:TRINITY_DN26836_c0_g1_i1.p1 TRINITY_DN26836_c0_g1~~TRINITY_DN26836_c0_g1_i1.p1  ORF type:complete len:355 (-),score=83.81 TRINITY_DN26836_c0_g1_i1:64-1128(-)